MRIRTAGSPAIRAARGLPPIAYTALPNGVIRIATAATAFRANSTITISGSCQKTCVRTRFAKNGLSTTIHELCRTIFAIPPASRNVPSVARIGSIPITAASTPFKSPMPVEARMPPAMPAQSGAP